jgi:hypothetical protein
MIKVRVYNPEYEADIRAGRLNRWQRFKALSLGFLAMSFAVLWIFGGFIGAIVAAFNDHLVSLVLSIFIPLYGAIYTIIMIIYGLLSLIV